MKRLMTILVLLSITGCKGISNGAELREHWEECEARFKGGCSMIAVPNSIPNSELNKLAKEYAEREESK